MNIKELREALDEAINNGWLTEESEVTIEYPPSPNNQYHVDEEYPWTVYYMLDRVFSLALGREFSELEYEEPSEPSMEAIEGIEMKAKYQSGKISLEQYTDWLMESIHGKGRAMLIRVTYAEDSGVNVELFENALKDWLEGWTDEDEEVVVESVSA